MPALVRETAAVSLGVFIGCLPLYGLHLLICWTVGFALGLNRLKMYLAANISNPFVAPWLIFAEVQTGAWLRRGSFHPLSRETITSTGIGVFGMDARGRQHVRRRRAGGAGRDGHLRLVRGSGGDPMFADLVRRASDRYLGGSITAWEFARGKLRMDPVYRATLSPAMLPPGGTLLDIGCGQGLMLALLVEARQAFDERRWPASSPEPPRFDRMVGIETRPRPAASARKALDGDAEVIHGDARTLTIEPARAVLLFDVLQLLESDEQEALLGSLASRLEPAGVVLIREADPAAGWRFTAVRVGNGLKALVFQHPADTDVQSAHPGRMARLLCAPRVPQRGAADGRRDAVRQRAVPADPGGGRVCTRPSNPHFLPKSTTAAIENTSRPDVAPHGPGWDPAAGAGAQ